MVEKLTNRLTQTLAWTAAAAFAASWFLPVLDGMRGWMAFRMALAPILPYQDSPTPDWDDAAPQVLSALTNVVFAVLFVLWQQRRPLRPGLFVRVALACLLLNLYWFVSAWRGHGLADLLIGYYVWLAAFALLAAVAILIACEGRQTSKTPTAGTPS